MAVVYEPGNYLAVITSQGIGKSKNKGTPYIRLMVKPLSILKAGKDVDVDFHGEREIAMWLTENTSERVAEDLIRLGYPFDTFDQVAPDHPKHHSFVGKEIRVWMKTEDYTNDKGETKPQERWALSGDQRKFEPMARNEVSTLNKFAGAFKTKRAEMGTPAPARQKATAPANNSTFDDSETI